MVEVTEEPADDPAVELGTPPSRNAVLGGIRDLLWPSTKYVSEGHAFAGILPFAVIAVGFFLWGVGLLVHGDWRGVLCLPIAVCAARGTYVSARVRKW